MHASDDSFASLIGHQAPVTVLRRMLAANRLPHALILSGQTSVGKMTLALAVASGALKAAGDISHHPDVVIVACEPNPKTGKMREQISVEQVGQARARFSQTPIAGARKVLVVADADRLSTTAANALLKTLEEPRGDAYIILTTTDVDRLLPTIRSRAQVLWLRSVARQTIMDALVAQGCAEDRAALLAGLAAGLPGVAMRLFQESDAQEEMEERRRLAEACTRSSVSERVLGARGLLPVYDADHVKTRTELLERIKALEGILREGLLATGGPSGLTVHQCANGLHGLVQLRKDLTRHLNPKLALIRCMTHV